MSDDELTAALRALVRTHDAERPRSRQRAVGPSQVGVPCARQLAYAVAGTPPVNTDGDPWAAYVGTAVHAQLADAIEAENTRLGRRRYLVEEPVRINDTLAGTVDLYDADTRTVIDHKVLGVTSHKKLHAEGPSGVYRTQVHLYGFGLQLAGHRVERVAIAAWPRSGLLSGLHVWSEPWDEAVVEDALTRLHNTRTVLDLLGTDPAALWRVEATPGPHCTFCDWFAPGATDPAEGCPGDAYAAPRRSTPPNRTGEDLTRPKGTAA